MIPLPHMYPGKNTYRMLHFVQREASEMERITETLADGIASARNALSAIYDLPNHATNEIDQQIDDLDNLQEASQLLGDEFREAAQIALPHLTQFDAEAKDSEAHDRAVNQLRDALSVSQRVADLLAADQAIRALRRSLKHVSHSRKSDGEAK